jgi:hypothetical protein
VSPVYIERISVNVSGLTEHEATVLGNLIRDEIGRATVTIPTDHQVASVQVTVAEAQPNLTLLVKHIVRDILRQITQVQG